MNQWDRVVNGLVRREISPNIVLRTMRNLPEEQITFVTIEDGEELEDATISLNNISRDAGLPYRFYYNEDTIIPITLRGNETYQILREAVIREVDRANIPINYKNLLLRVCDYIYYIMEHQEIIALDERTIEQALYLAKRYLGEAFTQRYVSPYFE